MRSTVPSSQRESETRCQETESSTQESESQGQAEDPRQVFPYNVAEFVPVYLEEDEALEEAIQRSLLEECVGPAVNTLKSSEMLSKEEIAGLLQAHSERVITLGTRPIYISRANVWTTALRVFKRPSFAESCDTFASDEHDAVEDAADLGGPRREFFRLLVKAIFQDSGAFEGTPNGCTPRLNMLHLQNGVYRTIGRMMSTIIVQGGEPPAFLSPSVVDYIVSGDILQAHVTPDDIGDPDLRENLNKVQRATLQDDLEKAVSCCDTWRYQVEGLPLVVTMANRDVFVKNAVLYHTVVQRQSCLDQLIDGLSHYGVLSLLRENPSLRVLLDIPGEDKGQEADFVAGILKPSYSVLGSNRRAKEELMVVKFREFLQCVENKELRETYGDRTLTNDEEAFLKTLSPGHILAFATGSSKVPAIGFHPTPKLIFIHDDKKHLPIVHTCANELHLFVNATTMADDEFNYCFLVALMNGSLFSTI
ncbi:G2/M phase-specific E3 ubiquitin-protein ligase-like isoform X1 [Sander lucioperca]|uniref:G2/M phase-specific E3 ubiquitin-protein ligase-like isoform X1 n=2 Tax=Sander lucioperca TaxID=283035 RepID=UPI001653B9B7|nr:G2/M phase-specific E3 ubiquitin-protein ligase-like isoform X1 [Sander lucioperca]